LKKRNAMATLDGPWAKWNRAEELTRLLYDKIREDTKKAQIEWKIVSRAQPKPAGSTDPRRWGAFTFELSEIPATGSELGLHIGEVVHNLRGSLDHLAWILVRRAQSKRLGAKKAKQVQFPMARNRSNFWTGTVEKALPGVQLNQRTFVERYQPYRRSPAGRAMRYLQTLSNADKHRLIVPVARFPRGKFNLQIKATEAELIAAKKRIEPGEELKIGTKIITAVLAESTPGEGKVRMEGTFEPTPGFRPNMLRPAPGETVVWVDVAIEEAKSVCAEILREIEPLL
jgi:hypothetical protein